MVRIYEFGIENGFHGSGFFKLFVPPRNLPLDAKVSCLIDFDRIC